MPISDKELLFNSLAQPHWDSFARETLALIYWTPQIIDSLDERKLAAKLSEIEKADMNISSPKSLTWFDQVCNSASSSVTNTPSYHKTIAPKKTFDSSSDAVVKSSKEKESKCALM